MPKSRNTRIKKRPMKKPKETTVTKNHLDDTVKHLEQLDADCRVMLQSAAKVTPLLSHRELIEAGDIERIHDQAKIFNDDMTRMYAGIQLMTMRLPDQIKLGDNDHLGRALGLSQEYHEWIDRFSAVVIPTVHRLMELLSAAADNLIKQKATASEGQDAQSTIATITQDMDNDVRKVTDDRSAND